MNIAESKFKMRVRRLLTSGTWPGPKAINGSRNLNGKQTRWRREVLEAEGYVKHPLTGRWGGRDRRKGAPL